MRTAVRELRKRRSGTRALSARQIDLVAVSSSSGLTARLRSQWRHAASEEEAGKWSSGRPFAVVSMAAIAIVASDEAMCEGMQEDEGIARTRGDFIWNDHHDTQKDSMSIHFDTEYEPKRLLGSGTFGVVMQCAHKQTGQISAVKMVQNIAGYPEEIAREKMALERLKRAGGHIGIVGYERSYYHNDFHYIVLEYVPGTTLYSFVNAHRSVKTTLSLQLISQLASALRFMHQEDIVHRDLKPENIMVLGAHVRNNCIMRGATNKSEGVALKIIDFGSAGRATQPEAVDTANTTTLSGTRCYWPPEVLQHQEMTTAIDMWALGCILYILISGRHPFDLLGCSTEDEVLQRVKFEPVSFALPVWHEVPAETKELILGLLKKDPNDRLSAKQVLEHPAIVGATKTVR